MPHAGYGASFYRWALSASDQPYHSYGNGAAMRISPFGWAFDRLEEALEKARQFTEVTHNHPEKIKGAQAIAAAISSWREQDDQKRRYVLILKQTFTTTCPEHWMKYGRHTYLTLPVREQCRRRSELF